MTTVRVTDLVKEYPSDTYVLRALDNLSFEADSGELVVLIGPSGSGKSTLLSCLGAIMTPTSGSIRVGDIEVTELSGRDLDDYRKNQVGFVFQGFNLIASLTARENVALPLIISKVVPRAKALERADELLELVGLADRATHRPGQLSGGQQQRIAVARGLVADPSLLIADEPTANLDHIQAEAVLRLLRDLRSQGRTIIVSTHDPRVIPLADRVVEMAPGGETSEVAPSEETFDAGTVIFEQGDHADVVYIVDSGEIDIYRTQPDGSEELLTVIEPGAYFGELGAIMGFPRSASARAKSDCAVTLLNPHEFRRRFETPSAMAGGRPERPA